jgi:hypothetical protein
MGAAYARGVACLKEGIDAYGAGKPLGRPFA